MNLYLDASVLVAILTTDPFTARAQAFLRSNRPKLWLSDFARTEFASVIARRVRTGESTAAAAGLAFATLDSWAIQATTFVETDPADIRSAEGALRRLDLTLRAADAVNIAIAQRTGTYLATFDAKMVTAARVLGVQVASI